MSKTKKKAPVVMLGISGDDLLLTNLVRIFTRSGWGVLSVRHTAHAIDELRHHPCNVVVINLSFVEWKLMGSQDHGLFCKQIRKTLGDVPVITVLGDEAQRKSVKMRGAARCILDSGSSYDVAVVIKQVADDVI